MTGGAVLERMLSFLGGKDKPPWQDKANYRVSKRGYASKCHLWKDAKEVAAIRTAVWNSKRKPLRTMQLIAQCGAKDCIRLSHLTPATKGQCEMIRQLQSERRKWQSNLPEIRNLAKQMQWGVMELSLVLRIPRKELASELQR
jgi:hypothetical protein